MRNLSAEFEAHLTSGATCICRAWIVRRKDGTVMGFTDHDRDLVVDGVDCKASTGLDSAALQTTTGLSVDNSQAVGALSDAAIKEVDIETGLYDGAEVQHWQVNWMDTSQSVLMFRGTLGEITRGDGVFEAELRGLAEALNQPVGRTYLRQTVEGFDFDISDPGFVAEDEVDFVSGRRVMEFLHLDGFADGWFLHGKATWMTGANAGRSGLVRADSLSGAVRTIELLEEPPFEVKHGDRLRVHAGCDGRFETFRDKFGRPQDFRGFPHMPGEDWSISYPASGGVLDGSSRFK